MRSTFFFALLLAVISGAAALSHELLWTRRLVDLLGATGEATSRVLGCFFLGLALGGLIAARMLPRVQRPWRAVASCELAIALLALPALCLPWWSDWIWPSLGPDGLVSWTGGLIKTFLSAAVVVPPAIPMGMTLPFFAAAVLRMSGTLRREGVWLYGANTFGGVIGLLVSGSVLLEALGVVGCMTAAIVANLAVGLAAWRLAALDIPAKVKTTSGVKSKRREKIREMSAEQVASPDSLGFRSTLFLAFLSGVAMLALEVLAIRMVSLVVPSSFQATVAVLASVILLLAFAALATPFLLQWLWSPRTWLLGVLAASLAAVSLAPLLLFRQTEQLIDVAHLAAMSGEHLATTTEFLISVCRITLITVGSALLAGGTVLPIVIAWSGGERGDAQGLHFGYLLAANGVGGIIGAELTHLFILPNWGIYQGFAVVGVLYGLGFLFLLEPWKRPVALRIAGAGVAIAAPIFCGYTILADIPYVSPRTKVKYEVLSKEFGRDGVLLVVESSSRGQGILLNNQYLLGSSGGIRDERREVFLPMLLHPNPQHVCCVGLATGISAGAALDYSDSSQLTAIELSALVTRASQNHFAEPNRDLFSSPRAEIVVEDGRTYIAATKDKFDVIVGDLYRPYGAGEGRLYSVEHFQAAREALREGGLFCQWLPMYQLTESHFKIIVASFLKAFPDAALLRANTKTDLQMLALLGWKGGKFDPAILAENCATLEKTNRVNDEELFDPNLVNGYYLGLINPSVLEDVPLNTLDNARIEILAGQRKVTRSPRQSDASDVGQEPYLVDDAWTDFEQRLSEFLQKTSPQSSSRQSDR